MYQLAIIKMKNIHLLVILFLFSCSKTSIEPVKKTPIELLVNEVELRFTYDEILVPFQVDGDVGLPEHKEALWISKEPINTLFTPGELTKIHLERKLEVWNHNIKKDYRKLRIPTFWEIERYKKLNPEVLSFEKYDSLKTNDLIGSQIYLVTVYSDYYDDLDY